MESVRGDRYKQLRVLIDALPDGSGLAVQVVARVSRGGAHVDRLLLSARVDHPLDDSTVAQALAAAGELISRKAFEMGAGAPAPRWTEDPFYVRVSAPLNRFNRLP